jgi:hypothetical protein
MSHWVLGKTKITDPDLLESVAMDMGLQIERKKEMEGEYTGTIDCEFVVSDGRGGKLAVVKGDDGDHFIQMDNYYNSICEVVGENGALLTRDYQTELHKREAQAMGGVIASQEIDAQGYVYMEVSI